MYLNCNFDPWPNLFFAWFVASSSHQHSWLRRHGAACSEVSWWNCCRGLKLQQQHYLSQVPHFFFKLCVFPKTKPILNSGGQIILRKNIPVTFLLWEFWNRKRPPNFLHNQAWPRATLWESLLLRWIPWLRTWWSREGGEGMDLAKRGIHGWIPSCLMFAGDECEPKSRTSSCWALSLGQWRWRRWNVYKRVLYEKSPLVLKWCSSEGLYSTCWQSGFYETYFSKWETCDIALV